MVSIRISQQGRLEPLLSCAPPPHFAARHYPAQPNAGVGDPDASASSGLLAAQPIRRRLPVGRRPGLLLPAFVEALLGGGADSFHTLSGMALADAGDVHRFEEIYLAPAARILGDLWLADDCDFLTVTIAVTRMERFFRCVAAERGALDERGGARRVLLALAPGNQHSFGLAMVEERFRQAGWTVECCGGDGTEMLRLAAAHAYDVIGLSVHSEALVPEVAALLASVRGSSCNRSVMLLGGGSLVCEDPDVLLGAGFDRLAGDAASAVRLSEAVPVCADATYRAAAE